MPLAALVAAACSAGGTGGPGSSSGPSCSGAVIKIAADLPLTGADAALGLPASHGIQFAVESKRCAGPYRLQLAAFDDASAATGAHDPATGVHNVEMLLADPAVLGLVGPLDSNVARAEIPVANLNSLAMVSPSNTDECLTQVQSYCPTAPDRLRPNSTNSYFRLAAEGSLQGPAAADFLADTLKLTTAAVMTDGETTGRAVADGFSQELRARSGRVVLRQDFDWHAHNDYGPFFALARQQGAQAVFVGMTSQTHGCTVRAAMKGALDVPFLGPDGIVDDQCIADAAGNADGVYGVVAVGDATQSADAAVKAVVAAYRKRYPNTADLSAFTFPAYDAASLLVDAIARAAAAGGGMPSRKQVIDAVAKTSGFKGTTGTFAFTAAGDAVQPTVSVYKAQAGAWVFANQFPVTRRS